MRITVCNSGYFSKPIMKGHMAKKQKEVPVQKRTGRVALISLFCVAAGVYAADTTDGWSYNAETATIEHNGESTRFSPIKKGNQFEDGSTIDSVSNVKVSGSATMGRDGVVFDGGETKTGTLTMEEGAVLDSNRGQGFVGGKPEDITTVKFEDGVKGKIDAAGATISAESYKDATAVSGEEIESITAKEISAKTVDVDNRNATAIDADTIGSVDVDKIVGDVKVGQIKDIKIGELKGGWLHADVLGDSDSKDAKVDIGANDAAISAGTIKSEATITGIDDGSMTIKKIGQVNGELTVNDYAKIENIENVDGKLTLNGGDKQATAKVGYAKELEANADGLTDVDVADTVRLKGEKLSLKGQTVKSESENSRTTIADLGKDETIGSVIVGDVKLDGSIDGFTGNLTANSTDDVNIENGYTGNIDIKEVRDADGNPAGNFRSDENAIAGDVTLGTVGNVEVNGGIAANGEAANGNLAIDNVLGNVDIKKGVAGDVNIGSAGGSMNVDGGIGGNFEIKKSEGLVNVDTVGKDMTIVASDSTIKVGTVVGTAKINGEGTFEIKNAGGLELGNAYGKLTITDNKLTLSDSSNINSMTDEDGNAIGTNIKAGGNVKVGTLDKETTIDGFNGNLEANNTADIKVGDKGLTGNLTVVGTVDGDLTADGKIVGNIKADETRSKVAVKNVSGDMTVGIAGGDVSATEVGGTLEVGNLGGKTVSAGKAGSVVAGGTGNVKVDNAGSLEVNGDAGSLQVDGNKVSTTDGGIKVSGKTDGKMNIDIDGSLSAKKVSQNSEIKGFDGDVIIKNASAMVTVDGKKTNITVGLDGADGNVLVLDVKSADTVKISGGNSGKGKVKIADANLDTTDLGALKTTITGQELEQISADGNTKITGTLNDNAKLGTTTDATVDGFEGSLSIDNALASTGGNVLDVKNGGKAEITVGNENSTSAEGAQGNVNVEGDIKKIDVKFADKNDPAAPESSHELTVSGNAEEARVNNGNAMINTVGKLTAFDEAGENVRLTVNEDNNIVIDRDVIDPTTGDVRKTQTVTAKVLEKGSLTVKDLDAFDNADASFKGDITVKGDAEDFTIGSVNNLEFNKGVDGNLTIKNSVESIAAKDADGNLKDITGALDVTKNIGEINVGTVGGKMTLGDAQGAVVADSANGVDATLNGGSLKINGNAGDVNLKGTGKVENIAESSSLTFTGEFKGQAQFGTISGDVNANGHFVYDLKIGTAAGSVDLADVNKLVIERATGGENGKNVTVGQVKSLDVNLEKDTNLFVKGWVLDTATVNGGCDATFERYAENVKVTKQLNGLLDIQSGVNNLEIKDVKQLKVGTVGGLAKFLGDGEITILENGVVTRFESGLEALESGKINVENEIVVADNNAIEAAYRVIEADKMISFEGVNAGEDGVVLRAAKLTGTSAKDIVDALYKDAYGIGADGEESLTKYTLVGDHGDIDGKIAADISEIADKSLNDANLAGEYRNGEKGNVVFNVSKNSFFENRATSENEKAFAQVLDSAEYTGNDASDERAVAVKRNYYNLAQNGGFASALPQAVSRAARMNMDLANIVHLDTINRTSATRDMINAYGKKLNEFGRTDSLVKGTSFVTVRNINRFASYGGDSYASGSNDYIYGGLVNAEYLVNEDLFAGLGVGGFQAKSSGKDNSGKAETQSFALNLYGDYAFYDGFDWYFGATYAFGMNNTDRQRGAEKATSDWNSNLVGVFSGVRYTWKPFEDQSIAIKPLVGLNANFLLNPSYDEDAGGLDKLSIEERDYSSFKTIVGVEAVKAFDFGLSVAARMFYTHEFADNSYNVGATLGDTYRTYGSFVYRGYEMDRDAGIFGVGLGYDINPDWRVYLDYAAEVSGDVYHT